MGLGLLLFACKQVAPVQHRPAGEPQVQATVVTIRTTVQPANRTINHTVVIGEGVARATDEAETWRLYDLRQNRVTFVDDLAKSFRRESMQSLIAARRAVLKRPVDREVPKAEIVRNGTQRTIAGVPATQSLIRLGNYQRELWFGEHPQIPSNLFAMMHASDPPSTRLAAIVAPVDEALLSVRGFPLAEHAEMPYGDEKMVVDRTVVTVERKNVPASMLEIPSGYKDATTPTAPPPARTVTAPPSKPEAPDSFH